MILAIDIDNKITNFGIFNEIDLIEQFSIMTDKNRSMEEIKLTIKLILLDKGINLDDIDNIIISTVVPELAPRYEEISQSITGKKPILISAGVKTGLNIKCESPKEVGSDRIIRAVAASETYKDDLIVISAGSITTIDYINSKKQFLGGLILPGIDLFEDSLHKESAKLPEVEIKQADKILGNNTISSIQSGIYYGYQSAVLGIVDNILNHYNLEISNTNIITTGIHASLLDNDKYIFNNIDNLGLLGLKLIYDLNKDNIK
ncbi:type III pantothenate kinase [uncultured Anaerococcus sp.]|uniref:type III pantothenate kinase n=1 Tax=uncultured Anaerococcus sp. TaxID=293428 RepID=UPI00261AAD74|nr:type III pantothenate kinase [uncultured Anaerococcus sp.]